MVELLSMSSLLAFLTLASLEIVLGIDNLVFLAIVAGKLPAKRQRAARVLGLLLAALGRILLLIAITWVITLDTIEVWTVYGHKMTAKDLILIMGGAFLLGKGTWEIHESLEGEHSSDNAASGFAMVMVQIVLLDLVFSIDSVLTAVGMVRLDDYEATWVPLSIMIAAIVSAITVMLLFAAPLTQFVTRHPTMKMLALSFLLLIGVVLVAEGMHQHIPRGYIYFAMAFSLLVELLNLKFTKKHVVKAAF